MTVHCYAGNMMQSEGLTKLQLYKVIKKCIFSKMDTGVISPERAKEILSDVHSNIVKMDSPDMLLNFCHDLASRYAELQSVEASIEAGQHEALGDELVSCLDALMDTDAMMVVEDVLSYHQSVKEDANETLKYLQRQYPGEYERYCKK